MKNHLKTPAARFIRPRRTGILLAVTAVVGLVCAACETPGPGMQTQDMPPVEPVELVEQRSLDQPGVLAHGDVIRISFPGAPDLNTVQKVRADGKVSLPLVGEVEAAGKLLGPFQEELIRLYEPELQHKEVLVVLEATSTPVYVTGAVLSPGRILLERPMTALEAIMEAGGFIPGRANTRKVTLIRQENGMHETRIIDFRPLLRGQPTPAVQLRPYDSIHVPQRLF